MRYLSLFFLLLYAVISWAGRPVGGSASLVFLNQPYSARIQAMGGINQTLFDCDISLGYSHPSVWNASMHKTIALGTYFYPGANYAGSVVYAHHFPRKATFGFGMNYITYGKISRTDETFQTTGNMQASEFVWYSGSAYHFAKVLSVGANAKFFYSQLAEFSSIGMATDLAFSVNDSSRHLSASLVATNVGAQFKPYQKGNYEMLPFDLRLGFSFGFKGFPIKFHTTIHHLHRWNIRYNNPRERSSANILGGDNSATQKDIGDEIFRHFIIGAEANIRKVVRLQLAYNHMRRQELKQLNVRGIAGISFGLGVHVKFMDIQYGMNPAALGSTTHHLTVAVNVAKMPKRKKSI